MPRSWPIAAALLVATLVTPRHALTQALQERRLSLGDAVQLAAGQNAAVDAAHARAAQATARIRQRRADFFPSLNASAAQLGRTFNTATLGFAFSGPNGVPLFDRDGEVRGPVRTLDLRARLSQTLFDAGALERLRTARRAAAATTSEGDVAAEQAAGAAAAAYVRLLRANAQVVARSADSTLAAELLGIAEEQLRAGVGIALDVTRARAQLSQLHAQSIAARAERERASLDLNRILALPSDLRVVATDSLNGLSLSATDVVDVPQALSQRPELRTLDAQLASAGQQTRALQRDNLPTLSAFGDNGPIAGLGGSYLRTYTWGIQLSAGIFDGFRRAGRIEEQAAVQHELELRRHDVTRQIALDVRGAVDELTAAREQLDAATDRVMLAEQELAQARDRFRAGVSGSADAITASLGLNAARTLVIDALAAWHGARIMLARAQGQSRSLH